MKSSILIKFYIFYFLVITIGCSQNTNSNNIKDLVYNLQICNNSIIETQPIILLCCIKNSSTESVYVNIPALKRNDLLKSNNMQVFILTPDNTNLKYLTWITTTVFVSPLTERIIAPKDSIYFYQILSPGLFQKDWITLDKCKYLPSSSKTYYIYSILYVYQKSEANSYKPIILYSDSISFSVNPLKINDRELIHKWLPLMNEFFAYAEGSFSLKNREQLYNIIIELKNGTSGFSNFSNFIYLTTLFWFREKTTEGITLADSFTNENPLSPLAEEMEFLKIYGLFRIQGDSHQCFDEAEKILEKYPRNLNRYYIESLLNGD